MLKIFMSSLYNKQLKNLKTGRKFNKSHRILIHLDHGEDGFEIIHGRNGRKYWRPISDTFRARCLHTFTKGFKTGLSDGQSMTLVLFIINHIFVDLDI